MKKIFLIFVLILITGCIPTIPTIIPKERIVSGRGIAIGFAQGMPPKEILASDYDNYNVKINLINYDETLVSGEIYLSDSLSDEKSSLTGIATESFSADGRIDNMPGNISIEFGPFHYYKGQIKEGEQTKFNVDVDIPNYKSVFNTQFCIGRSCSSEEILRLKNYSPIDVEIKKLLSSGEAGYRVLMNVNLKEISGSIKNLRNFEMNAAGRNFKCGEIEFDGKTGNVNCELEISVDEDFVELPLEASLNYDYKVSNSFGPVKIIP